MTNPRTVDSTAGTVDSGSFTVDGGTLALVTYPSRIIRMGYMPPGLGAKAGPLPYGEWFAAVGDIVLYGIDWDGWLANYWQRGANVPAGTSVRPRSPNGYALSTVLGGWSGDREPISTTIGQTVCDGSILWTCQAIDTTSLSATVQSVAWKPQTGITVDRQTTTGQMVVALLDASAATAGTDYTINVPTALSDGETKVGRIVLKVR